MTFGVKQREIPCCHGDVEMERRGREGGLRLSISCVYSVSSPAVSAEKVTLLVYDHPVPVGFIPSHCLSQNVVL